MDNIREFYNGSNVLITGATGFFGKLLIQKLLQTCDDVKLFIMIREKRGESIEERIAKIFDNPLYDQVRKLKPNFMNQIHTIDGDFSSGKLILSNRNEKLLIEKVNIIFHCAANLNMLATFNKSINVNIRGTQSMLELSKKMKKLKSMMVVSTVYANCHHDTIEERVYKHRIRANDILELLEEFDELDFEHLKSSITDNFPNVYCFTKAMAEDLVTESGQNMPIGIFRPSIVASTYNDPIPGWTDNVNGILGVMLAIMIGIMRVTYGRVDTKVDFVPADMCVNALICTAWDVHRRRKENGKCGSSIPVYNFCADEDRRLTWKDLRDVQIRNYKYAFKEALWAPFNILTPNAFLFNVLNFLLHTLPAIIYDFVRIILGKPPKLFKTYRRMDKTQSVLVYFNLHEWKIQHDNVDNVWKRLSDDERRDFHFDTRMVDYDIYFSSIAYGIKKYYLKEGTEKLKEDAVRLKRLNAVHKVTMFIVGLLIIVIVCLCSGIRV